MGGTLLLYIIAEIVIVGFLAPAAKRLSGVLSKLQQMGESATNEEALLLLAKVRNLHIVAGIITALIFAVMVLKPV